MQTDSPAQRNAHLMTERLAGAVAAAGYAPSIQDTQPWRWRHGGDTLDLHLERSRVRDLIDPDTRLATLSCGAALYHARTVLAAEGWPATVARMPDAADQEHLARLRVDRPAPVDQQAALHVRALPSRYTDRGPVTGAPVGSEDLRAITAAVQAEGAWLHILGTAQLRDLAAAADQAQRAEAGAATWRAELAYWTGITTPTGTANPSAISAHGDRAALFAILYGHSDEPRDWLRAGEALGAGWLTATERGVTVLPLSAPVEVTGTRDTMRRLLSYLSHPYLVLRFGTVDPARHQTRPARAPMAQLVETG
jgi:hypothetical protein